MDAETLSRIQFAGTVSFHFIYPPLSMGLGMVLVFFGIAYLRTKDLKWRRLSFFWTQIYGLIFALGVATGIVQEFEFGMNWAAYARFVGNVFGSLLAAEGVFAFFLEGGFLGLMLFGGSRLGPRMWFGATCVVVFAAHFSALWIIMANSWMQTPAGYELATDGGVQEAVMTDFWDVMFTPSFLAHILHVWAASWTAGAALVLSVSAYYILRDRHLDLAKSAFKIAMPFFAIMAVTNLMIFGSYMGIEVTDNQPVKLAAIEGLWDDESCAPLYIFGWVDESEQTTTGFSIPCLLSFLAEGDPNATVQGLNSFSEDDWAPVNLSFQVYHYMIDLAMIFAGLGIIGAALYYWKGRIYNWRLWFLNWRWLMWIFVVLPVFTGSAVIAGWWTAEVGRQPWIVWELMKTEDGVSSNLTSTMMWASLGMFIVLYTLLFILFIYLLNARIHKGPQPLEELEEAPVETLPDSFREIFRRRGARASGAGELPPSGDASEVIP